MDRSLFSEEHDLFRTAFRQFIEREVRPHQEKWREEGSVSREVWRKAGEAGFLCPWMEDEHGGSGGDFIHSVIVNEELSRAYESGFAAGLHSDVVVPYIYSFGSDEQKKRWLPGCASGELITALAMTEPGAGSDLASLRMNAERDGDHYVLNGTKTFISNGILCDLCVVAVRTELKPKDPHKGLSLLVVEADTPGFIKGKKLAKIGLAAQDTSELIFEDCRVPVANRLGEEGSAFLAMMQKLQQERLVTAMIALAMAEQVVADAIVYCKDRQAFGRPISKFQNTQFKLAECAAKVEVGRAFLDKVVAEHVAGKYLVKECSMAKLWVAEMGQEVVHECLQLYGGYGYMLEYPIARAYTDMRVQSIFAGTSEIMKVIIAQQLGL